MTEHVDNWPATDFEARGEKYRLRLLRGPRMEALLPLFDDVFGFGRFSAESLRRKYSCEHNGVSGFACVAFSETEEAAGAVGVLPWPMRFGSLVESAAQMVDVATGSAHRGRGLFVRLAELAHDVSESLGIAFLFGFPNEAAYPIWMHKLDFEHIDDLVEYQLPIRTIWVERVANRFGPLRPAYDRYVERVLRPYVADDTYLENSLLSRGYAGVDRDPAFHAYKSRFGGSRVLAVDGGRAWITIGHGLLVGDIESASEDDLDKPIRSLVRLARRLGLHRIVFQASADTHLSSFFPRFGRFPGMPVIYRDICSEIPADRLRFTFGDLDNF